MEKLEGLVPESVKHRVAERTVDDLPSLSSTLVDLFLSSPQFHQLIGELVDPNRKTGLCAKNKEAAVDYKQKGNHFYSTGDHSQALRCYSQLVMQWYRSGKVNASLGNYEDAVRDLNVAKDMELSLGGKRQIESELDLLAQPHERKNIEEPLFADFLRSNLSLPY